jgi:hypothetical protein
MSSALISSGAVTWLKSNAHLPDSRPSFPVVNGAPYQSLRRPQMKAQRDEHAPVR